MALIGLVGGEGVHYAGTSAGGVITSKAYNYNGPVGEGGVKLTPSEGSQLTVLEQLIGTLGSGNLNANQELSPGDRPTPGR